MTKPQEPTVYDLTYEWPTNILRYDARIFGLSLIEVAVAVGGFLVPLALWGARPASLLVSVTLVLVAILTLRKVERWGNRPLPLFLWHRWRAHREATVVVLPLIMGVEAMPVRVEDPEQDTAFWVE